MKKTTILLILLLGLTSIQVSGKWFQQKNIYSKALLQEKTYYVGLPKGYNEADTVTKYPVIIFLHGASITATDMVNSLEPFLDNFITKLLFDRLFKVIFIIPDGSCEPYKGSFYTNSLLYGNYEDYIIHDMMDEIASKYHTYNRREKWSLMGHSMGGYGAMKIAMKYPQKFIGVSALSGPLNITYFDEILPILESEHGSAIPYDFSYSGNVTKLLYSMAGAFSPNPGAIPSILFPVDAEGGVDQTIKGMWEKQNPINFIREWKGSPAMAIHTYCGELDEFKLAVPNKMFSDTLAKYNLPHTYKQDPKGDHVNSLFTSLPQGINFLYQVMDTAQIRITTQVEPMTAANSWSVYPNPANDRFYLSGALNNLQQIVLSNLSGQKVMQIEYPLNNEGVNISKLDKGVYFVSLQSAKGYTSTLRLIKR
ncbi:MAG TPA: alpha/beta hydrolase-fold protein [Prolixibacteraceae bacterium]|jgi:S-formylglutathione hydrolase FrmB